MSLLIDSLADIIDSHEPNGHRDDYRGAASKIIYGPRTLAHAVSVLSSEVGYISGSDPVLEKDLLSFISAMSSEYGNC